MEKFIKIGLFIAFAVLTLSAADAVNAQAVASTPKPAVPSTIFRDSDGNLISNNEFVDIRMANFHYKDATVTKILDDGTVEFRLQKIPQEGGRIPHLNATTLNGAAAGGDAWKGKVVVLNFWFIGCPACIAETPKLNVLRAKFASDPDVVFAAITADQPERVRSYLKKNVWSYEMIADGKDILNMFGFSGYPKNIVIGRDGTIVYWRSTVKAWSKFESVIRQELEKQ